MPKDGEPSRKGEEIKKTFLGNSLVAKLVPDSVYRDRLSQSLADAKANIKAAEDKLKTLPDVNKARIDKLEELDELTKKVAAAETLGQTEPFKAWKNMEVLAQQAEPRPVAAEECVKRVNAELAEIDKKANTLREELRLKPREVLNDKLAKRWTKTIGEMRVKINKTLEGAKTDTTEALSALDQLEDEVKKLGIDTDSAKNKATGQRKASRQTSDAVFKALGQATDGKKDNRLGKLLAGADSDLDQYGYTLKAQIKSVLDVFDDRFAQADKDSPEAARENTAMRVAAIASAMALRLVKQDDINDPHLKPLVAKTIVKEYGRELAKAIASKKAGHSNTKAVAAETKNTAEALKLAEALLGEDPVTKVLTGKITGPDAVESIRRQAKVAGLPPARMFALQRQQLEMRVGSISATELDKGKVAEDLTPQADRKVQGFILHDLYGELSPGLMRDLVAYHEDKGSSGTITQTSAVWKGAGKGSGLEYKPTGKQLHQVQAGDTLKKVAKTYYGDDVEKGIEEIKKLNKYVFWTKSVSQDTANKDAKGPKAERRNKENIEKFLDKPLPKGAVLTVAGKSSLLDQLADYLVDDVETEDSKDQTTDELDKTTADPSETTVRSDGAADLEKPKVTPDALGKAAKRLLPPVRPEVLNQIMQLKKSKEQLSRELEKMPNPSEKKTGLEEQLEKVKTEYANQSRRLMEYRSLASALATRMEDEPESAITKSTEYVKFQKLRLELSDPNYIQAPGLGQEHSLGGALKDSKADERPKAVEATEERNKKIKELDEHIKKQRQALWALERARRTKTAKYQSIIKSIEEIKKTRESLIQQQETVRDAEKVEGREGALNERQYAHLKMLDRWDQEEKERIQAETGRTVEENVIENITKNLKINASRKANGKVTWSEQEVSEFNNKAKDTLKQACDNILSVPLTITFKAETLFSDSTKNEPAHGSLYLSEVVYSRKDVDLESLVGRGDKAPGKAAITGGVKTQTDKDGKAQETGWVAGRGKNYMRWRTDKDDREAHGDRLPFKDQQIFGAANPNWEKTHGGTDKEAADDKVGTNYYGNAHFLLKDTVRSRIAYISRAQNSLGGGKTAFQRKDVLMLFHDMSKDEANLVYLRALANIGKTDYQKTANFWEFHLYGGFDMRKDAEAIYLADVVDKDVQERIKKYAEKHGIQVVTDKPKGVEAENKGPIVNEQI